MNQQKDKYCVHQKGHFELATILLPELYIRCDNTFHDIAEGSLDLVAFADKFGLDPLKTVPLYKKAGELMRKQLEIELDDRNKFSYQAPTSFFISELLYEECNPSPQRARLIELLRESERYKLR